MFTSISYRDIKKILSASDFKFLCSIFSRDTVAFPTFDPRLRNYLQQCNFAINVTQYFFYISKTINSIFRPCLVFIKKIISAPRALREFVDSLKFIKKCQIFNEPTVDYLQQTVESQLLLFITKKCLFFILRF